MGRNELPHVGFDRANKKIKGAKNAHTPGERADMLEEAINDLKVARDIRGDWWGYRLAIGVISVFEKCFRSLDR